MPEIVVLEGNMKGQTFSIVTETVFIGRSSKNDIQIIDGAVSRKQIKIFRIGKKYFVEDLKSTNGTLINGERIPPGEGFEVDEGDIISIGKTTLQITNFPPRRPIEKKLTPKRVPDAGTSTGFRENERRSRTGANLELVCRVSELLKGRWDLPDLLDRILEHVMDALPRIHRSSILIFEQKNGNPGEITQTFSKSRKGSVNFPITFSRSIVERVKGDGKAVRMSNTAFENVEDILDKDSTLKIGSVLCVPLISDSVVRGALYVDTINVPYGFRKDDLLLLNSLSGSIALAIAKAGV